MQADVMRRYFHAVEQLGRDAGNLGFYVGYLFDGVELAGRTMLDVGGGDGRFSFYASCAGAAHVVCLEPEAEEGAVTARGEGFRLLSEQLEPHRVELVRERLQDYEAGGRTFDVVLAHSSINHLDEDTCMRLHRDPAAQERYVSILRRLAELTTPGAALVVTDCARRNLFGDLHLPNPLARTIEWHKHQSPRLWAGLLERAGFVEPRIRWTSLNTLRTPGRILLGNRVGAYCLASTFCLTMRRA